MIQIAYYDGLDADKRNKVVNVLQALPYTFHCLEETDLQECIGTLMGLDGYTRSANKGAQSSMELMILNELNDDEIQMISTALRAQDAHVPCKAMVTKHNKDWILLDLLTEIAEEHAYFQQYDTLKQAILELSTLDENSYTKDSWSTYQQACVQGYIILQEKQSELSAINALIKAIQEAKTALKHI